MRYLAKGLSTDVVNNIGITALEEKSIDLLIKQGSLTEGLYPTLSSTRHTFFYLIVYIYEESKVPIIVLAIFCSEGDNIPESIQLIEATNQYLRLIDGDGKFFYKYIY